MTSINKRIDFYTSGATLARVRDERHEAHEAVVAVEAELLAHVHERLVGEERADLGGLGARPVRRALRAHDDAARRELGVVAHGRRREAHARAVVVEQGAVRIEDEGVDVEQGGSVGHGVSITAFVPRRAVLRDSGQKKRGYTCA